VVDLTAEVDVRPTTKKGKGKAPAQGTTNTTKKGNGKAPAQGTTNKEKGKAPVGKSVRGAKNKRKLVVQVEDEESSMMDLPEEVPQRDLSEEEEEEVEKSLPPTPDGTGWWGKRSRCLVPGALSQKRIREEILRTTGATGRKIPSRNWCHQSCPP